MSPKRLANFFGSFTTSRSPAVFAPAFGCFFTRFGTVTMILRCCVPFFPSLRCSSPSSSARRCSAYRWLSVRPSNCSLWPGWHSTSALSRAESASGRAPASPPPRTIAAPSTPSKTSGSAKESKSNSPASTAAASERCESVTCPLRGAASRVATETAWTRSLQAMPSTRSFTGAPTARPLAVAGCQARVMWSARTSEKRGGTRRRSFWRASAVRKTPVYSTVAFLPISGACGTSLAGRRPARLEQSSAASSRSTRASAAA
mmetsp:Transcript_102979/g.266289  ORF Transcript_102979/g.266289 Transcript_102979/m.266289 type:complete len:260 (-) Transcript_102979:3215-3994(-)